MEKQSSIIGCIFDNKSGQILVSVLLGLGLSSLFRQVCKDNNCQIIKSPPKSEVEGKIFKEDDKCYTYKASSTSCNAT